MKGGDGQQAKVELSDEQVGHPCTGDSSSSNRAMTATPVTRALASSGDGAV